jgi:hypothetical protein
MAQQQEPPIYWDQHASRWNLTLIFALVVAVLGIITGYLLTALGLAMAAYSWFTTPRQYLLYRDRMMIVYGMPRTRVISFAELSHAEILALPFGERLRLRMVDGKRLMLMMRDPSAFMGHLEDALARYHGEQTGGGIVETYGTVLTEPAQADWETASDFGTETGRADSESYAGYNDAPVSETESYTGRVEEASSASGSYTEVAEPQTSDSADSPQTVEDTSRVSGSYTEAPAPDYSGEGRPAYGADVELDTGRPDEQERPPSPY